MKPGRELALADLKTGMMVLVEAVAPPDPLYLPGAVLDVEGRSARVRMGLGISGNFIRLHTNRAGRFCTSEHRPVRVFESEVNSR